MHLHTAPESALEPDLPVVSVIVPTRNRAPLLGRLLDALDRQEYPRYDIWIVDDASTDDTPDILARRQGEGRYAVRQRVPLGSYAARNRGWTSSAGDVVAFTDDDCIPSPTWLSFLVAALNAPDIAGVQGVTLARPGSVTPFTHQIDQRSPGTPYRTCNMAYRRDVLESLGGFDERFHSYGDTLFGLRARQRGVIAFAPNAVVFHPPRPKEWRNRQSWEIRLRDDLAFRRESRRYGMEPDEMGEVEPFMASKRVWSDIAWVTRPLWTKLRFHLEFGFQHPGEYINRVPDMARDRLAMLEALMSVWLDRSRSGRVS